MTIDLGLSSGNVSSSYFYQSWLDYVKNQKTGYFMLSNSIEEYLPLIKSPAINLYIFYAIHANNEFGNSYYSVDSIARKLNVSNKTITNWNSNLQDAGLIIRQQISNSSSTTQLRPTSDFILNISDDRNLQKVIQSLENDGFKEQTCISLISLGKSIDNYKYRQFRREFSVRNKTVVRYIALKINNNDSLPEISASKVSNWMWLDTDSEQNGVPFLNLLWSGSKINKQKISDSDVLDILKQLSSQEKIDLFKKRYPKYELEF